MVFEKVLSTINKHNLIESGDKIVIGISGGPDSVCLLHILSRLKDKLDIELYAAHLNHQIRGIEAQKDALYVSDICDKMGITYFLKSIDVPKYCEDNNLSIEEGARKLRYEMFDEIKQKTKGDYYYEKKTFIRFSFHHGGESGAYCLRYGPDAHRQYYPVFRKHPEPGVCSSE